MKILKIIDHAIRGRRRRSRRAELTGERGEGREEGGKVEKRVHQGQEQDMGEEEQKEKGWRRKRSRK